MISYLPVIAYNDPYKTLVLENDACEYDLGAVLMQEIPVAFSSRYLSDTEHRYAQIEKVMLAVAFGFDKYHYYTHGRNRPQTPSFHQVQRW